MISLPLTEALPKARTTRAVLSSWGPSGERSYAADTSSVKSRRSREENRCSKMLISSDERSALVRISSLPSGNNLLGHLVDWSADSREVLAFILRWDCCGAGLFRELPVTSAEALCVLGNFNGRTGVTGKK